MKEATGELNATIFVILAVGVLIAFFYFTLWPIIRTNFVKNTQCSKAICDVNNVKNGMVECHSKEDKTNKFKCVYKG